MVYAGIVLILFCLLFANFIWNRYSSNNKFLKKRLPLKDYEFYELYLQIKCKSILSIAKVITARDYVADYLGLPKKKIFPEDDLNLLGPAPGWDFDAEIYYLLDDIERASIKKGIPVNASNLKNLADIIDVLYDVEILSGSV